MMKIPSLLLGALALAALNVVKAEEACLAPSSSTGATTDETGRACRSLMSEHDDQEVVAQVCLALDTESHKLVATFTPVGDWKMVTNKFWYGSDVTEFPRLANGAPDLEAFPAFYCNYTTYDSWETSGPLECADATSAPSFSVVAYAEVEKWGDDGPLKESRTHSFAYDHTVGFGTTWMGWYDFVVDCNCDGDTSPPASECPTTPELVLKTPGATECHPIIAGGTSESAQAGTVCVQMMGGSKVEVTFSATNDWALLRSQLWVGQGTEDGQALEVMPRTLAGAPDTKQFKNYACNHHGTDGMAFTVDLKYECVNSETIKMYFVAHSKVAQVDAEGRLLSETESDVFALEHQGLAEGDDVWYGWFDVMAECVCPTTPDTPLTAALLPPPETTEAPAPGPTCENAWAFDSPSSPTCLEDNGYGIFGISNGKYGMPGCAACNCPSCDQNELLAPPKNPCVQSEDGSGKQCYNTTVYNWDRPGPGPWDKWTGFVCVEMTSTSTLDVTFETATYWKLWEAHVWAGDDISTLPTTADGSADLSSFPYKDEELMGEDTTTFTVDLDLADVCSQGDTYSLKVATHSHVGDPCIPFNGSYIWGSDYPAWGQDVDDVKESTEGTYMYFDVEIACDCEGGSNIVVPPARRQLRSRKLPELADEETCNCICPPEGDAPSPVIMDLHMEATDYCQPKGEKIGTVSLSPNADGTATVTYETVGDYALQETHLYIGGEVVPLVAPELFAYSDEEGFLSPTTKTYTVDMSSCDFYIAAEATVCGEF